MTATHPLVVGADLPSDDVNYGGDDTGPERYFIDHAYHFHHVERTSFTSNRRTRSSQSMSSISIDSVDEAAWSEATRRFIQEASNQTSNRLRTIGEQRPASLSSVDFDKLNGFADINSKGYISFAPTLGAASTSRPFSQQLRHGYPSTDSLMYSHSDRSSASTPLASPITTPDISSATMMANLENSLLTPPSLKKTNRIPPRWRYDPRITKSEHRKELENKNGAIIASPIPNTVSLDSGEEDDIEIKDTPMPPWDSSNANHNPANDVFRSTSTSTRSEENPLIKVLTDHLADMSCTLLDAMSCSRSFDSGDEGHTDVMATPSLVSLLSGWTQPNLL